jgi:hypothetical protein
MTARLLLVSLAFLGWGCGESEECGPSFLDCLAHCMAEADEGHGDGLVSFTCDPDPELEICECGDGGVYAEHWAQ